MITQDLYKSVLMSPCQEGADELHIISGYANATMATQHLEDLKQKHLDVNISLLIGMCPLDGIAMKDHEGFQNIMRSENYAGKFSCSYIFDLPPVHSKVYIWLKNKKVYRSFVGSANYTGRAFFVNREVLAEIQDRDVCEYFNQLEKQSILCNCDGVEETVRVYSDNNYRRYSSTDDVLLGTENTNLDNSGLESIEISFLSRRDSEYGKKGDVPTRAGINWGQRPGRNPNQAYIQLPPEVYRSDFFPPNPQHFTVVSDDSKVFICVRREKDKNGQAIHTPLNNADFGEYFRNRMGLANGQFISKQDLLNYGRTSVTFYKIDNENYYMDFS
jgi:hypothetical protein